MSKQVLPRLLLGLGSIVALVVLAVSGAGTTQAAPPTRASTRVCGLNIPAGSARCHAWILGTSSVSVAGLTPAQIKAAYNFPTSLKAGKGKTIAIVDAYDDPTAEADLATFSSTFGLPACTTANGCFKKVNQNGGTTYPPADGGWALEISLDIQWAHAIAPKAKILLVEASSASFNSLLRAEDYAKLHAQYVSNSWGGSEFFGENTYDSRFVQSGVSFFVSAGDDGTPAEYPSASRNVISVGGTYLQNVGLPNQSESAWDEGGGGCSVYETANPAQNTGKIKCNGKRATPDVSLVADPASGVAVYDSTCYYGNGFCQTGWFTVGGTSASSPMWAARSAAAKVLVNAAYVYGNHIAYRDITTGNNGKPAKVGFDLATGRGSWTGTTP